MPRRLRPTAEVHPDAILVGDPGRAMALAQALTEAPKMSNHARGLWGYSGDTENGRRLTIQATGIGGPSAALVLGDLAELGVRRAIRVGTCAALDEKLQPGSLVCVRDARPWSIDGRGAGRASLPDESLSERLRAALGGEASVGEVASLDVLLPSPGHAMPGGDVADMQTAALFAAGRDLGVRLAAVLVVTDSVGALSLEDEDLADHVAVAGRAAAAVLSALV